ncbi:uncharacterized protein A4U43_C08F23350 [Asparagus officinalis]|nr:uncharacterized protein A4U43_C08F23350 [Asparagus officinalis]
MPGFNRQHSSRSTVIRRTQSNSSPDPSFIFFRNHTAALDRCSSVSDGDALFSILNLAASPDPDPQRATCLHEDSNNPPSSSTASYKAKEFEQEEEGEEETLDPSKHSFSHAVIECKNRRFRSESHSFPKRKPRDHRPTSLDFNGHNADVSIISPRFLMSSLSTMKSPGTPNYRYPKGWSSERVPPPSISSRRYMPFNNGRPIPSKWEDAEKWIFSPVGSENAGRSSVPPPHHRRPSRRAGPRPPA